MGTTTAFSLGLGGGSAVPARSLGRGGGSAAAATRPTITGNNGFHNSSSLMDGFSFVDGFPSSSTWFDAAGGDSSPGSWT
ncbi:unnamed protein product [Urochloa humidicola]